MLGSRSPLLQSLTYPLPPRSIERCGTTRDPADHPASDRRLPHRRGRLGSVAELEVDCAPYLDQRSRSDPSHPRRNRSREHRNSLDDRLPGRHHPLVRNRWPGHAHHPRGGVMGRSLERGFRRLPSLKAGAFAPPDCEEHRQECLCHTTRASSGRVKGDHPFASTLHPAVS